MIYALTSPNDAIGYLVPPEDAYHISEYVLCVADGITRDPLDSPNFSDKSQEELLRSYPNPSGARWAADLFCAEFSKAVKTGAPSVASLHDGFLQANSRIAALNRKYVPEVNYLVNDFYGCVAAGAVVDRDTLYWGNICDTGIRVFSCTGKLKFATQNGMTAFERNISAVRFDWSVPEGRRFVREEYRNRPAQTVAGDRVSYGALTGETAAEDFIKTGTVDLASGDLVILYTDGFEPVIQRPDFFDVVYRKSSSLVDQSFVPYSLALAREDQVRYGKERTIIIYLHS